MPAWFISIKRCQVIWKTNALTLKKLKIQVVSLNRRHALCYTIALDPSLIEKHLSV